jgi:hypothetical protein
VPDVAEPAIVAPHDQLRASKLSAPTLVEQPSPLNVAVIGAVVLGVGAVVPGAAVSCAAPAPAMNSEVVTTINRYALIR